jgi:enoyl-CoA hydratase/carnithine racemase
MNIIEYERRGPIGYLTIAHPPKNLLQSPVFADPRELEVFLGSPELLGVVVKGKGRHFSGGADLERLEEQAGDPARLGEDLGRGKSLLETLSFATVPVVAAIRGQCLGAGLEIALACHLRVVSDGAMLGFPEATHGLLPGLGGTLAGSVARKVLVELVLSGRLVGAEEALALGLADRLEKGADVEAAAARLLAELTEGKPPELIRAAMESIHNGRRLPRDEALRRETELFCEVARRRFGG